MGNFSGFNKFLSVVEIAEVRISKTQQMLTNDS